TATREAQVEPPPANPAASLNQNQIAVVQTISTFQHCPPPHSQFGWVLKFPAAVAVALDMLDEMSGQHCLMYPQYKIACWAWRI
ncbi:unnamed protein product, partial [Urochloa humidicola]